MKAIINNSLNKSISYKEYKDLVKLKVEQNSTTGTNKTEALVNYTKLNNRRMKRWDKTVKIEDEAKNKIEAFKEDVTWLVITESWCGDAAHIMPVLNKITDINENINYKVVLRDENPELMNAFLTNGNQSIPKVIMIDNTSGEVINTYGPRPSEATHYVNKFKAEYGKLTPEFKEDLQRWYNKDKGQNVIRDITTMMNQVHPSVCQ